MGPQDPKDEARDVQTEAAKVASALSSRRRSMNTLGIPDPDAELAAWMEESERMTRVASPGSQES